MKNKPQRSLAQRQEAIRVSNILWITTLFLGLFTTLILRSYQMLFAVDYHTGYFKETSFLNVIFSVSLGALVVWCLIRALLDRDQVIVRFKNSHLLFFQISAMLFAVLFLMEALSSLFLTLNATESNKFDLLQSIFAFGSVLGFFVVVLKTSFRPMRKTVLDVLIIFPCLWSCTKLINTFINKTMVVNVSETTLELLAISFFTLFFLAFAKLITGDDDRLTFNLFFFAGSLSAVFCGLVTLPAYFAVLFGSAEAAHYIAVPSTLFFVIFLFSTISVCLVAAGRFPKQSSTTINSASDEMK